MCMEIGCFVFNITCKLILTITIKIGFCHEDIQNFIDSSLKDGHDLSTFVNNVLGDYLGISYWYQFIYLQCKEFPLFWFHMQDRYDCMKMMSSQT